MKREFKFNITRNILFETGNFLKTRLSFELKKNSYAIAELHNLNEKLYIRTCQVNTSPFILSHKKNIIKGQNSHLELHFV